MDDNYTPRHNEVSGVAWERTENGWVAEPGALMSLLVLDDGEWTAIWDGDCDVGAAESVEAAKHECVEAARSMHRRGLAALDSLDPRPQQKGLDRG